MKSWFVVPTTQMPIFVLFVSAGVSFGGGFSMWVSLMYYWKYHWYKLKKSTGPRIYPWGTLGFTGFLSLSSAGKNFIWNWASKKLRRNFRSLLQPFTTYLRKSLVFMWNEQQFIYTLLLIITPCFTCGERKICSTIRKSQNIMNMIEEIPNFLSLQIKQSRQTLLKASDPNKWILIDKLLS